jgi:hypothetical protein
MDSAANNAAVALRRDGGASSTQSIADLVGNVPVLPLTAVCVCVCVCVCVWLKNVAAATSWCVNDRWCLSLHCAFMNLERQYKIEKTATFDVSAMRMRPNQMLE